jgi:hypothetical protein
MKSSSVASHSAAQALRQNAIPALRRLRIEETTEVLVLTGTVPSYYYKQLAQEAVLPYRGDRELVNRVVVVPRLGERD